MLPSMGLQRVGHDLATEQQQLSSEKADGIRERPKEAHSTPPGWGIRQASTSN